MATNKSSHRMALLLLATVVAAAVVPFATARWVVTFNRQDRQSALKSLQKAGFKIKVAGPDFAAVVRDARTQQTAGNEAAAALMNVQGVQSVEPDLRRTLPKTIRNIAREDDQSVESDPVAAALGYDPAKVDASTTCAAKNTRLGDPNSSDAEVQPYGIRMVQADRDTTSLPRDLSNKGMVVCVIDSGLSPMHPDLVDDDLEGCAGPDAYPNAPCPFNWDEDGIGHGTHVTGTIAALKNGKGVVGVIPKGAEVYMVRVFDENENQGDIYSTDMVMAYSQCEGHLAGLQAENPTTSYRMVVSMSLGGPGPVTIESMWFSEAFKRGDILFVAASGNDGENEHQVLSYPASYSTVMSVAAVNCTNHHADFSNYNGQVDVAGPGVDVRSTVPKSLGYRQGALRVTSEPAAPAGAASAKPLSLPLPELVYAPDKAGLGNVTGEVIDCGRGDEACPKETQGNICIVQGGGNKAKWVCDRVAACMKAGAKAVIVLPKDGLFQSSMYSASMDCTDQGCNCWSDNLSKNLDKIPPVLALSGLNGQAIKTALAGVRGTAGRVTASVEVTPALYQAMSGTSMATPHVSAVAARVWADFPGCGAADVRRALEQSALPAVGGTQGLRNKYTGYGLVQAEAAYAWLASQPCATATGPTAAGAADVPPQQRTR